MAAVIQIQDTLDKLTDIPKGIRILYPRLKDEIKLASEELNNLKTLLADKKCIQKLNETDSAWEFQCLQSVYKIQDIADPFIVKSMLKRRKGRLKMQPFIDLKCVMSQYHLAKELNSITLSLSSLLRDLASKTGDSVPPSSVLRRDSVRSKPNASSAKWEMFENSPRTRSPSPRGANKLDDEAAKMVGRTEEARRLCAQLMDSAKGLDVISVLGAPGSGKTTLVKMVYNSLTIKKHFWGRVWVQVPVSFSLSAPRDDDHIQQFRSIAHDLSEASSDYLPKPGAFLIVVEDVNETEAWDKISPFFLANCPKGSKVLITTRDIKVAQHASRNQIHLHKLSDKDSWTLFLRKAYITEDEFNNSELSKTSDHVDIKERILRQCEGSPLAISMLGGLLCTKELSSQQWLTVIDEHATTTGDHDQSVYSRIFAFSIADLPDELKRCFMYLAIFPRAFDIPERRLFRLWTAEGLINNNLSTDDKTLEDVAEEFRNSGG